MSRRTYVSIRGSIAILMLFAAAATPRAAHGQFAQYTQPGNTGQRTTELDREQLEAALAEARWNLGAVRLEPWVGLKKLSWNANPFGVPEEARDVPGSGRDTGGDLTATVGAGLRAFLPIGHHLFWTAHALPEYVWWAEQDERNTLNGRYGVALFGFFNRVHLQLTGRREETQGIVTPEVPAEIDSRQDRLALATETRLGFSTSVFGEASVAETRSLLEEDRPAVAEFERLDRDERTVRGGIRYRPRERWSFDLGWEWTESESAGAASAGGTGDLSNTGSGPIAAVRYSGPTFFATGQVAFRDLEADGGSAFRGSETETYSTAVGLEGNRLSPVVYARRQLTLSLQDEFSHFTSETVGLSLATALGRRTEVRAFGETGENDFVPRAGAALDRTDDVTSFGIELTFELFSNGRLRLGGWRSELDSSAPGEDRTLEVVTAGVEIGFGRGDGGWI